MHTTDWDEREYGHRAKVGLIVPANNNVIEPELWKMAPEGGGGWRSTRPACPSRGR